MTTSKIISTRQKTTMHWLRSTALYLALFAALCATGYFFALSPQSATPFFENSINIWRFLLFAITTILLIVAAKHLGDDTSVEPPHRTSTKTHKPLIVALWLMVVLAAIIMVASPDIAAQLVRREDWPFYRNAIFIKSALQIVASIIFIKITLHYKRSSRKLLAGLAAFFTFLLIFIAGEELSWGQRLVGWDTPEFILENNEQGEFNLHNLSTQLFQNSLYFAGWLLLVAIPFWRKSISHILRKLRLNRLADWLPPAYFTLAFAPAFAIADPLESKTGLYFGSNLFIAIATLVILLFSLAVSIKDPQGFSVSSVSIAGIIFIAVLIVSQSLSGVWQVNPGAVTEYLEIFIAIGFMLWSREIYVGLTSKNNT